MTNKYQPIKDLIRQGKKAEARAALEAMVRADPGDADAWYGLAQVIDDPEKKDYCLKRAYALRPSAAPKAKRKTPVWVYVLLVLFAPLLACLCLGMASAAIEDLAGGVSTVETVKDTPPPPAAVDLPTETRAVLFPPTWTPAPVTPTETVAQITPTRISFSYLTMTPTIINTLSPPQRADYGPLIDICDCSHDAYNCSDFNNQVAAQYCFSFCNQVGKGDIHNLDGDADGRACEDY